MKIRTGPGLLFLLIATMGIGPLVNYGLSTTSSLIISDFRISDGQFGLLTTACFLAAALSSSGLGRLSDRLPLKRQLTIVFGGTAAALIGIALAPNYWWLLVAMVIAGPTQSLSNPLTNRIIMDNIPAERRGSWIGVKQSGVQASQLFAGLFFPSVALLFGWTGAAAASAAVALVLMLWSWRRVGTPPGAPEAATCTLGPGYEVRGSADCGPRLSDARGPIRILALFSFFAGAGLQATNAYLPLFAQRQLGIGLVLAGLTAGLSGLVGIFSRILWGRQMNAGAEAWSLLLLLAIGAALGTSLLLASGELRAQPLMWLGVSLHGAAALGINAVVMAGLMRNVRASEIGAASGSVSLGLYSGFAAGPSVMGMILEGSGGFGAGWAMVLVCYGLCAALALLLRGMTAGGRVRHTLVG